MNFQTEKVNKIFQLFFPFSLKLIDFSGMPERQCTLTGPPAAIAQARSAIERIIASEGTGTGNRGPGGGGGMGAPGGGMGGGGGGGGGMFEMNVPGHKVGLIIGKGGETIKQLQERSGAKIIIIQDSPDAAHEKPLRYVLPDNAFSINFDLF